MGVTDKLVPERVEPIKHVHYHLADTVCVIPYEFFGETGPVCLLVRFGLVRLSTSRDLDLRHSSTKHTNQKGARMCV